MQASFIVWCLRLWRNMRDFRVFTADSEHNKFIIPILACHLTDSLSLPFSIPISAINIITLTFILQLHAHKHFVSLFSVKLRYIYYHHIRISLHDVFTDEKSNYKCKEFPLFPPTNLPDFPRICKVFSPFVPWPFIIYVLRMLVS